MTQAMGRRPKAWVLTTHAMGHDRFEEYVYNYFSVNKTDTIARANSEARARYIFNF